MSTLAVTGSTGAVGGRLARLVADLQPRLLVRDPARAPQLTGCEVRRTAYDDPAAADALAGVEVLFMVSASESANRRADHRTFIDSAARAGVRHVVYTSFLGASPAATFTLGRDHADAEEALRESGMACTLLRDNFYTDVLVEFADRAGVIRGPAGRGRVASVARADVADAAAAVLRQPEAHAGAVYDLTGPESFDLGEFAARASKVLGRSLRYEEETLEEAYASRRAGHDADPWQLDAWVSTYTAIADGSTDLVSDDVRRLTGHPARTLEETLRAL